MNHLSKMLKLFLEFVKSILGPCYNHCKPVFMHCYEYCKPILMHCWEYCKPILVHCWEFCKPILSRCQEFCKHILYRCKKFQSKNTKFCICYAIVTPLICIFCISMWIFISFFCHCTLDEPWLWFANIILGILLLVVPTMLVSAFVDWYEETWGIKWPTVKSKQQ